jgi:hypothetical protein
MKLWWWISVPYSIIFPVCAILSNGWFVTHVLTPFFVLSWATALSSAVWTFVTLIKKWTSHNIRWTKDAAVMFTLGLVASLWLLQPLGVLKWVALR